MHSRQYRRLNRDDLKRRLTADELNTMPDWQYRRLEDHYRVATRKGLQLRKARTRDPSPSNTATTASWTRRSTASWRAATSTATAWTSMR